MKPLEQSYIPASEFVRNANETMALWIKGDPTVRKTFPGPSDKEAREQICAFLNDMRENEIVFKNDVYQVNVRRPGQNMLHLSIKRIDRQCVHDWRDLQDIKNQIVGEECEAVEIYPAESRRIDTANQYHLWACTDPKFRFPVGWDQGRLVTDDSIAGSVNRPLPKEPNEN